jgi:hypothetical protein
MAIIYSLVESIAMAHFLNNHGVRLNPELNAIVASANPEMPGQSTAQWLRPADVRPVAQPFQDIQYATVHRRLQPLDLTESLWQDSNRHPFIITT